MKNKDLQKPKPIYVQTSGYDYNDELSLIDLALILLNRLKLIIFVLVCFISLGITIALLSPKKYTYSTSLEIGSQVINGSVRSFESPQALLAKIQHSFIPKTLLNHRQSNKTESKKYKVNASVPKDSNLIVLGINGTEKQASLLNQLLLDVNKRVVEDHSRIYKSVEQSISSRLNSVTDDLNNLKRSKNNNEAEVSTQLNLIELYSSQLSNLRNTRELLPPMKSLEPTGTSRVLIVIIASIVGLLAGIFGAFFTEFISKVRDEAGKQNH